MVKLIFIIICTLLASNVSHAVQVTTEFKCEKIREKNLRKSCIDTRIAKDAADAAGAVKKRENEAAEAAEVEKDVLLRTS